jgi:hypothetical protein
MGSPASASFLAQTEGVDQIGQIFVVCLYLFVGVIVLMAGAFWLRRWSRSDSGSGSSGFSPDQLRKLRKEGKMSEEEYKRAHALITQALKAQFPAPRPTDPKSPAKQSPPRRPPTQPPPDAS